MAVWPSADCVGHINKVTLDRAWSVSRKAFKGISSCYVTSHLGQLSLLPSAGQEMSTCLGTVAVFFVWTMHNRLSVIYLLSGSAASETEMNYTGAPIIQWSIDARTGKGEGEGVIHLHSSSSITP